MSETAAVNQTRRPRRGRAHFVAPLLGPEAAVMALYVKGRAAPIASHLEGALSSKSRRRGLLGRASLEGDRALLIAPCNAIHTFRMQFAIDVVYAARNGRVLKVRCDLRPNRISVAFGAFATIEMAAGALERSAVRPGAMLHIAPR